MADRKAQVSVFRYYEKKLPDVDELVMVRVKNVGESAAYVSLTEYNNIEGMVPFTELSRRRIRSISKHIKVGSNEVMAVIRVDKDRGYVDLSKKKVSETDHRQCEERFAHAKTVHGILQSAVMTNPSFTVEQLYIHIGWPLYKRFDHAYDGFKLAMTNPEKVTAAIGITADTQKMFDAVLHELNMRMKESAFRIRAEVEVTLYTQEGIDGIKEVLLSAEALGTAELPIKVHIIAAPHYVVRTQTMDKAEGLEMVDRAVKLIIDGMQKKGGECIVRNPTHILLDDDTQKEVRDEDGSTSGSDEEES